MSRLSVVIPTRLQQSVRSGSEHLFLDESVESVRLSAGDIEILAGVDLGTQIPKMDGVTFVESHGKNLCAAVNAAAARATGEIISFLEDDDRWHLLFIAEALHAIEQGADFVSSTQIEVGQDGHMIRINDFPTPSGWVMRRKVWDQIGGFDESLPVHQDNDWLGRLGQSDFKRVHLAESTAPESFALAQSVRPWLAACEQLGGPNVTLKRHSSPIPLVERLIHESSWLGQVSKEGEHHPGAKADSDRCFRVVRERYGFVPW